MCCLYLQREKAKIGIPKPTVQLSSVLEIIFVVSVSLWVKVLFWVFGAGVRCDCRDSKDEEARRVVGQSNGWSTGDFYK